MKWGKKKVSIPSGFLDNLTDKSRTFREMALCAGDTGFEVARGGFLHEKCISIGLFFPTRFSPLPR